ncbi:MAG: DNA-binding protein [Pseudomonadota bacterium]
MSKSPTLTPESFDALLAGPEKIWGLQAIGDALGVSRDKVRRLARLDGVPIYCPGGTRYFALRSELNAWLKTKQTRTG